MSELAKHDDKVENIFLTRDTDAILIPAGVPFMLKEGTEVTLMQSLGSSYTILFAGNLARIDGKDADSLHLEPADVFVTLPAGATLEEKVWHVLYNCYDPEIPVNIVELGLIYKCEVKAAEAEGKFDVFVDMTLTAPGCGMGSVMVAEIRERTLSLEEINDCTVNMVFDPPWGYDNMSEAARLELGLL